MFRNLVDTVGQSRAYVYVLEGPYLPGKIEGCVVLDVGGVGIDRYLRMYIKPSLPIDRMIAVIGHELQHVLEILEADAQRVPQRKLKPAGGSEIAAGRYETQAATDAGRRIATELRLPSKIPQGAPDNE